MGWIRHLCLMPAFNNLAAFFSIWSCARCINRSLTPTTGSLSFSPITTFITVPSFFSYYTVNCHWKSNPLIFLYAAIIMRIKESETVSSYNGTCFKSRRENQYGHPRFSCHFQEVLSQYGKVPPPCPCYYNRPCLRL